MPSTRKNDKEKVGEIYRKEEKNSSWSTFRPVWWQTQKVEETGEGVEFKSPKLARKEGYGCYIW